MSIMPLSPSTSPSSHRGSDSVTEAESTRANTPVTEDSHHEPTKQVAVVGMACRVAGSNNSPEQLWESLLKKEDASGEMPSMRWEPYHRRDSRNPKSLLQTTSRGYYLDHLEDFDAQFFGISPMEAEQMDPQQRISLEVTWEALENAGLTAKSLSGTDTAVFWGVNSDDYSKLVLEDLPNIEAWMGIGTAYCGVPNRISYHLNLKGPSSAVDAACASSLVAIHHGVQAILFGESKVAIVGGVNALCGPGLFCALDRAGALSPEGRCCSFDNEARGYGRGEGAAAIILKEVSQAIQDGDHILAIIKGTAVAHDGKTKGIMAPNADAQALVSHNALKVACIDPLSVGYVEAHATSTPIGDPTEISAIASVYGTGRKYDEPCFIGSIKPNIGHLEAGAGAMGFIKAVLAVQKGILPPQANLENLTKRINWDASGLKVVQEITKWPDTENLRRAAISSYGYGGTVSHAIIEGWPSLRAPHPTPEIRLKSETVRPSVLLFSGPQEKRISIQAQALRKWMESNDPKHALNSISATLAMRRDHHDYRSAVIADDHGDALRVIKELEDGANHRWTIQSRVFGPETNRGIVWVFSGHGAQWAGMGKGMLQNPVFYHAVEPLDRTVNLEIGVSPIALLRSGDFKSSDHVQILTYIMQIGISAVLHSYGIYPHAVIGHSVGEIAASVVSGALTPQEGVIIVTRRSVLYRQVMGEGAMLLVNKPYAEMSLELQTREDLVAAIDASPSSCVLSGSAEAVNNVAEDFKQRSLKVFTVKTDIAFHSPMLNKLVDPLLDALVGKLSPTVPTRAKLYSTSLQDPRGQDLRGPQYWANNMVNSVRLTSTVQAAIEDSYRVFMEISSHPLISHSATETLMNAGMEEYCMIPTLIRGEPGEKNILHAIAQLHCRGVPVDWGAHMSGPWITDLPNTRWIHRPAWRKIETGPANVPQTHKPESHTLLGNRTVVAGTNTVVYTTILDRESKPFPGDHPLHGTEIVPAACLFNTFIKATGANVLENVVLRVPLATNARRSVQVISQRNEVKILSQLIQDDQSAADDLSWVTHTTARWDTQKSILDGSIDIDAIKNNIKSRLSNDFSIDYLSEVGVPSMGFPWLVKEHYSNTNEMLAQVDAAPDMSLNSALPGDSSSWASIFDAATSVGSTIFKERKLRMPAQVQKVDIFTSSPPPKICWLYIQAASHTEFASHISILNESGHTLAKFTSMRFSEIEGTLGTSGSMESLVHEVAWVSTEPARDPLSITQLILVSDNVHLRETYADSVMEDINTSLISVDELLTSYSTLPLHKETAIVFIPDEISEIRDISEAANMFTWQLLEILKLIIRNALPLKIFVLTSVAEDGCIPNDLAHASLVGLSRVLASEHPDHFGGLIDIDQKVFPLDIIQNIQGADIIRVRNGLSATARLRSLPRDRLLPLSQQSQLLPQPKGTYLITGGLGALGLEVAGFLVDKGARRLILVSRRSLPPRKTWGRISTELAPIVNKIKNLEAQGASVHVLALDIGFHTAAQDLLDALERLSWPPVLGVIHAAGVLDNQLALETTKDAFARVMAPKVIGGMVLHEVFPPRSVDFFILFSSCGQLVGFTGQSSYGSANSFLDALATHRRRQGDHALSILWTSWRGLGMGASTDFIKAELESKGITDVTRDEAFAAWMHLSKYDVDHGVVLRSLAFDRGELLPAPILEDIAIRREGMALEKEGFDFPSASGESIPQSAEEIVKMIMDKIRGCVAHVLHMIPKEVDPQAALSDLGVDSVITVMLRRQLQQTLKVKVPPTLTWSHPTVGHLVKWFVEKMTKD